MGAALVVRGVRQLEGFAAEHRRHGRQRATAAPAAAAAATAARGAGGRGGAGGAPRVRHGAACLRPYRCITAVRRAGDLEQLLRVRARRRSTTSWARRAAAPAARPAAPGRRHGGAAGAGGSGGAAAAAARRGRQRRGRGRGGGPAGRRSRRHQRRGRNRVGRDRWHRRRRHRRLQRASCGVRASRTSASHACGGPIVSNNCCACEAPAFDDFMGMACGDGGTGAISYVGCRFIGGIDRIVVAKRDTSRNLCVNVVLRRGRRTAPAGLTLPPQLRLERVTVGPASQCPTNAVIGTVAGPVTGTVELDGQRRARDRERRPDRDVARQRRGDHRPRRERLAAAASSPRPTSHARRRVLDDDVYGVRRSAVRNNRQQWRGVW